MSSCGTRPADPYQRNAVQGTVLLDGKPLASGSMVFFPIEEGPVVSGASIQDGKFSILAAQGLPAGSYKVSITSTVAQKPASTNPDELIENPPSAISLIPAKYNTQTTLTAEVKDGAENVLAFDLKSK